VQAGTYTITASAMYHVTSGTNPLSVSANGAVTANLTLPAMGTLSGTVLLPSGAKAAGATLTITGPQTTLVTADTNGAFSTIGLAAGTYTVDAAYTGLTDVKATATVSVDARTAVNLQFGPTAGSSGNAGGSAGFTPIRVRAGGGAVTDANGNVWAADTGFIGGYTYSDGNAIPNTNTPALYQAQRYNIGAPLEYRFTVPNGSYSVTLKFAETYFTKAGQRVANILINGQTMQQNFDIVTAAGGPNLAIDETYPVTVTNGVIDIQLTAVVENPEINALQIVASATGGGTGNASGGSGFTPIRVRAGGGAVTDANGNVWAADTGFIGGYTYSDGNAIPNTNTPALYQAQRYNIGAPLEYRFTVPNASYSVTLKFAETYFTKAGQRVANVLINGQTVQQNFDIVAAAGGPNLAIDETYPVTVTNGVIDIQLTAVIQNPEVNAIQIVAVAAPSNSSSASTFTPIYVNAGGPAYLDSTGTLWDADRSYTGGTTYSTSAAIANTADGALYQTERYAAGTLQYSFTVPNGSYQVRLKFSENYFSTAGQRVENIVINGATALSNFDIAAAAGGPRIAIDEIFPITVTNGSVLIQFQSVVQNAKIDAIAITN
jgi:hypothetical protein